MEVIILDIGGPMAHFRKFFANNTAFSYTIPPRTTLMGMLAALAGWEKGSYHEAFSCGRLRLSVELRSDIKKQFHRMNYLMIKSKEDFQGGRHPHIQTPFEVISGQDLHRDLVSYRLYIAAGDQNSGDYENLKEVLLQRNFQYALTLGPAFMSASILDVQVAQARKITNHGGNQLHFHSAMQGDSVEQLALEIDERTGEVLQLEEEMMPAEFKANHDREVSQMIRTLYSSGSHALSVHLKPEATYYELSDGEGKVYNIQFLE